MDKSKQKLFEMMNRVARMPLSENQNQLNTKLEYWGTCVDVDNNTDFDMNMLIRVDSNDGDGIEINKNEFENYAILPNDLDNEIGVNRIYTYYEFDNGKKIAAIYDVEKDIHYLWM